MTAPTRDQAGFSLIELMVAMVVTLIVTGAIYGLLAGGQSAFRREPQLADRQQNTRRGHVHDRAGHRSGGSGPAGLRPGLHPRSRRRRADRTPSRSSSGLPAVPD